MDEVIALLRRLGIGAWRHRWLGVAIAWVVCLAGWGAVMALPARYESSAQLYVAADPVLSPLLNGIAINGTSDAEFALLRQTLLSRPNLETLIEKAGLGVDAQGPGARDALMKKLVSRIHIDPQSDNLFTISYNSRSPEQAYRVVQTLIDVYIEKASTHNQSDINNATAFIDSQIAYFKAQLQKVEQQRANFQAKYLQLLPGANGISQFEMEQSHVRSLKGDLQDTTAQRDMMEQELAKTKPLLTPAQAGGGGVDPQLLAAEEHLAELEQRYTAAYPGVIDQKKIVAMLKSEASGHSSGPGVVTESAVPNPIYEQLKVRLIEAKTAIFSLKRKLKTAIAERERLAALARAEPHLQAQFTSLDRNYGVLLNKYHDLLSRRESMRIGAAANIDANEIQLQVVNPPQLPRVPYAPKRSLLLAAVLVLGLGAGAGCAVLFAEIQGCFYTIEDLRRIGLPVIGGISQLHQAGRRFGPVLRVGVAVALLIIVFGGFVIGPALLQRLA